MRQGAEGLMGIIGGIFAVSVCHSQATLYPPSSLTWTQKVLCQTQEHAVEGAPDHTTLQYQHQPRRTAKDMYHISVMPALIQNQKTSAA